MPKIVTDARQFIADRAGALATWPIEGASVRLHWTDQPYRWHVNEGAEVFLVLDGEVEMRWRQDGGEHTVRLGPTDMFIADVGDEHIAHPIGQARVLVIEKAGSV